jgi:esterase/lipase superfamily enzyme
MRAIGWFRVRSVLLPALVTLAAACAPTVYLMPTPEALRQGRHDPFSVNPGLARSNRVAVAYATNRLPVGPQGARSYLPLFDDTLRLGVATVRIGSQDKEWEDLYKLSTTRERHRGIELRLEKATEVAPIPLDGDADALSPEAQAFFRTLNEALGRSLDEDLTLYVHGANNDFYRACAHAAQYHHFTGRNSLVMVYAWPSAGSLLRYAVDVRNASQAAPVLARLLELLARHSVARHIDILAYSAGAQVLSPALAALRTRYAGEDTEQLRRRLRLGELYFAAPDIDVQRFLGQLAAFIDMAEHVTVAANPDDSVLAMAASHHGVSRAGRADPQELSAEETRWVIDASRRLAFDIIWVDPGSIPGMSRGSHRFWYANPWVSTDVLVQLLYHARPADRGLEVRYGEKGARFWVFPHDYPERASRAIERLKEAAGRSSRQREGRFAGRSSSELVGPESRESRRKRP